MANIYVRSTDGSDSDNGTTWALAKATIVGAGGVDTAGDTIYMSSNHSESLGASQTFAGAGTAASPLRILSVNDAAEPPTTIANGATLATTSSFTYTLNGSFYMQGVTISTGAINFGNTVTAGAVCHFNDCTLRIQASGTSGQLQQLSSSFAQLAIIENCTLRFNHASNFVAPAHRMVIRGGGIESGTVTPTNFMRFGLNGRAGDVLVESFDFSNFGTSFNLVEGGANSTGSGRCVFRNCKMPTSWAGSLTSTTPANPGMRVEMYNCDSGDTNYRMWISDFYGSVRQETTVVKSGGASDGVTALAWKMESNSNATFLQPLISGEIARAFPGTDAEVSGWTPGASKTVTVEIVHDSATALKDSEVWLEVQYLGTSGYPLGTITSDRHTSPLSTGSDQASSSVTWTTTGLSAPNKQKLSVTITPQERGYMIARVYLAKASYTVYVDPKLTVA
jgi:hypothetical protein